MTYGITSDELALLKRLAVNPLIQEGARVWLFGSRARGDHRKFSDIDLLFELPNGDALRPSLLSEIRESLEESTLPYKVDLVPLSELAEAYKAGVLKDRIELK